MTRFYIIALSLVAFSGAALAADCKEGETLNDKGECVIVLQDDTKKDDKK